MKKDLNRMFEKEKNAVKEFLSDYEYSTDMKKGELPLKDCFLFKSIERRVDNWKFETLLSEMKEHLIHNIGIEPLVIEEEDLIIGESYSLDLINHFIDSYNSMASLREIKSKEKTKKRFAIIVNLIGKNHENVFNKSINTFEYCLSNTYQKSVDEHQKQKKYPFKPQDKAFVFTRPKKVANFPYEYRGLMDHSSRMEKDNQVFSYWKGKNQDGEKAKKNKKKRGANNAYIRDTSHGKLGEEWFNCKKNYADWLKSNMKKHVQLLKIKKTAIKWMNSKGNESGRPYDFVFELNNDKNIYIDIKTTKEKYINFYMSKGELEFLKKNIDTYFIVNLINWNKDGGNFKPSSIETFSGNQVLNMDKEELILIKYHYNLKE